MDIAVFLLQIYGKHEVAEVSLKSNPIQISYAYEKVSEELGAQIAAGSILPGDQLPGEVELAEMFGVNRSTIREAIRSLEGDGFLSRGAGRRLFVSIPGTEKLASRHTRALGMMQVTFMELWHVAHVTEPLAAELAALNRTDRDIEKLEENYSQLEDLSVKGAADIEVDIQFHLLIAEAGNNRALLLAREPIGLMLYPAYEPVAAAVPQAAERQIEAHRHILDAIKQGDEMMASEWMRKHIEDFRRGYEVAGLPLDAPLSISTKDSSGK